MSIDNPVRLPARAHPVVSNQESVASFLRVTDLAYLEQLGSCLRIAGNGQAYRIHSVRDLFHFFACAVRQGRAGFFGAAGRAPSALLVWAFFDADGGHTIAKSAPLVRLHPSEWNTGSKVFLLAYVSESSKNYALIKQMLRTRIQSIARVFVRSSNRVRCYEPALSSASASASYWARLTHEPSSLFVNTAGEERLVLARAELQQIGFFQPQLPFPMEALRTTDLSNDFWIGIAAMIALSHPRTSTQTLTRFLETIEDKIRDGQAVFYFSDNGHPEALMTWTAGPAAGPTTLELLLAPKGLHMKLVRALKQDLSALPQPINYRRERGGRTRVRQRLLTAANAVDIVREHG